MEKVKVDSLNNEVPVWKLKAFLPDNPPQIILDMEIEELFTYADYYGYPVYEEPYSYVIILANGAIVVNADKEDVELPEDVNNTIVA